jgi:hypothetical protein
LLPFVSLVADLARDHLHRHTDARLFFAQIDKQ